ncbi:unnamed protein product [Staurois parvus]|uniref:Secreted protein n=1 Tax=Staurois parvus TaxID=386267 RepID=A0ABN9F6M6_9NEOB|nr:unnamed protein product [Staurois parvus]
MMWIDAAFFMTVVTATPGWNCNATARLSGSCIAFPAISHKPNANHLHSVAGWHVSATNSLQNV